VASLKKRKLDPVVASPNPRARKAPNEQGKFAWKNVPPAEGEAHEKKKDGKEYVHCPHHGELQWVLKEGHLKGCDKAPNAAAPKGDAIAAADPATVKAVVTALTGIVNDEE
jgi:hypothetical protein